MTATPDLIIWVVINILGVFIFGWLALISWERKTAVLLDKTLIQKKAYLHVVTKQLRNRVIGATAHFLAILLGFFHVFEIILPYNGVSWLAISIVLIILVAAIMNLYGEVHSS